MSLRKYANILETKNFNMQETHASKRAFLNDDNTILKIIEAKITTKRTLVARYSRLVQALNSVSYNDVICLNEYAPVEKWRRYEYIKTLTIPCKVVKFTHSTGRINITFLWKIDPDADTNGIFQSSVKVRDDLLKDLPIYHTRAMRSEFIQSFGKVTGTKSAVLREAYRRLTNDSSAAGNIDQELVDKRVQELLDMQDPDLIWDLRVDNKGQPENLEFLAECKRYIEGVAETAVDDCRHDNVENDADGNQEVITHLATALSISDLHNQVSTRIPDGTAIPPKQWLSIQMWPRKVSSATSRYFTGRLKLKFMVQSRQFRKSRIGCHYASSLFRYEKEFSIKCKPHIDFVCMDDKHTCKVGEPGYPLASVERGKRVLVNKNESFQVGDHDFSVLSITPSVTFLVDIPDTIESSFYRGQVYVGIKENCFEPSSPIRHMTELTNIMATREQRKEILCLYTDGGPDHRLTYLSVQIALIALFLHEARDMVIAVRTPPYNSWKDPAERIMSILTTGLQSVGLMRASCQDENTEDAIKRCKSMKDIRNLEDKMPDIKPEVIDSLKLVKDLLKMIFERLSLKGKTLQTFDAASEEEITELWDKIIQPKKCCRINLTYQPSYSPIALEGNICFL